MRGVLGSAIVLLALAALSFVASLVLLANRRDLASALLALAGAVGIVGVRHAVVRAEPAE